MAQLFTNNARSLLVSSIAADATSIVIEADKADLFPVANVNAGSIPSANNWFKMTLQDVAGNVEIVAVRTRAAGSSLMTNVIRGYDGTTARAFTAGAVVGLRVTAADVYSALAITSLDNLFTGDNSFSGANEFTGAQTFSGVTSFSDEVTFADSPTSPTLAYGDSTTKLATTAFVQAALQALYPVGSIYTNAGVTTNPATLFGFGTWVAFGAGRVMVGLNGSDTLFDSLGETGGSKDAITVAHTHTGSTSTSGIHNHDTLFGYSNDHDYFGNNVSSFTYNGGGVTSQNYSYPTQSAGSHTHTVTLDSTGSSGTNANLQPYITVAMWKRTA